MVSIGVGFLEQILVPLPHLHRLLSKPQKARSTRHNGSDDTGVIPITAA